MTDNEEYHHHHHQHHHRDEQQPGEEQQQRCATHSNTPRRGDIHVHNTGGKHHNNTSYEHNSSSSSDHSPAVFKEKASGASDEGDDEGGQEEGFSSAHSSPIKQIHLPLHRHQSGNHVRLQDIELGITEEVTGRRSQHTFRMSSVDNEVLEKQELTALPESSRGVVPEEADEASGAVPAGSIGEDEAVGYITQLDKDGNIQQVPIKFEEEKGAELGGNPLADFMSADILAKPFNFVSGNTTKSRFNPFRKKSGLLNVLARQATKNRLLFKNGSLNTYTPADGSNTHKFLQDIFVSIIDLNWGWIYVIFAAAFFLSWLAFAVVWYITFLVHGDFDPDNIAMMANGSFVPCASAIQDFTSCFLFSLETQHTIGYGGRATTEQCSFAIIVMSTQSIIGVIIQACMAGVIFAKFTVPKKRGQTIVFSKNAVITMRNGALYLICRVSDLRKSSLLEAHIRMLIIRKETTEEGEVIPFQLSDLDCTTEMVDGENDRVLILWPVTIAHKINEDSPLYEMTPRDVLAASFEVIVTLEGVTEETGNTIQVRTSYLPNEILWGHHFDHNVVVYDKKMGSYMVHHNRINKTAMDDTPRCSARQLNLRSKRNSSGMSNSTDSRSINDKDSPRKPSTTFKIEKNK